MWKHVWDKHNGEGEEKMFEMRMEMGFKKPLARQIREGVEIEMCEKQLMNSKSEWNNSRIPRIIIEEGEKQREDESTGLGRKDNEDREQHKKREIEKIKLGKRQLQENEEENNKKRKVTWIKRNSKDTERYRIERRNCKRTKERKRERLETEDKEKTEMGGINYWREKFREMADISNKKKLEAVPGALEHIKRIEKGRETQNGEENRPIALELQKVSSSDKVDKSAEVCDKYNKNGSEKELENLSCESDPNPPSEERTPAPIKPTKTPNTSDSLTETKIQEMRNGPIESTRKNSEKEHCEITTEKKRKRKKV